MKFSIITPTYKRRTELERAISSLIRQTHSDWEMIIVNDSPHDESYNNFVVNDPRIRYYINDRNKGVNFSRNVGLEKNSAGSKWVIFLDDDDYLAPDCLKNFMDLILVHGVEKWFMTNRAKKNGESLTITTRGEGTYSYARDYLLLRRIKGDATHCIENRLLQQNRITFLKTVKQGEEWFFFYQVGLHTKIMYSGHNSTISGGYDTSSGLNFRERSFQEKYQTLVKIFYEGVSAKIISGSFLLYMSLRSIKLIIGK